MKAALVTGCSAGGTGYAIVKSFQRRGFHVFATARDLSKMTGLEKLANVTLLKLEITSSDDIKAAVAAVEKSGHSLEYLVNNAGAAPCMPALDVDIAGGHAVFETNFWGTLSMCQAFVPMLIEQKGCIVTINSVNSFLYPTWMSMYNAAKAAQRAMLETMRAELEPLGVRVLTVVAGALDTQIMSRQAGTFTLPEHSLYKSIEAQIRFRSEGEEKVPRMNADTFAEKVVGDALYGKQGLTWRGQFATVVWTLLTFFPWALGFITKNDPGRAEIQAHYSNLKKSS